MFHASVSDPENGKLHGEITGFKFWHWHLLFVGISVKFFKFSEL